jgi:hypothetical protein
MGLEDEVVRDIAYFCCRNFKEKSIDLSGRLSSRRYC